MTRRLLLSYLGIAVLILLILEVPLAVLAERFERSLATTQAEREANGLVAVAGDDLERSQLSQLQAVVTSYEQRTGGEVAVVGVGGQMEASSSNDADDDASSDWKPLISRALAGSASTAYSGDEGASFAVAAVPVASDGSRVLGAVILANPASLTQSRIQEIRLALAIFAAGALVVTAGAGVMLARSVALPLRGLESVVDDLGHGRLDKRADDHHGPSEIRSLARQFNQMADRIDELVGAQRRFVAEASHQLRSPLTALRLRIENLEAESDDASADSLAAVGAEIQRLTRIVDGLLTLGRAGQDIPETQMVDVARVIEERCASWCALADERGVEVVAELGDPTGRGPMAELVEGDLDQIVDNLLANAVEVSSPGERIDVRLGFSESGRFAIHVVDQGPGLSEEDRRRAFDRFWQGSDHKSGHSGLGLSIVRQLAIRNGLVVELRPADGKGLDAVVGGDVASARR